MKRHTLTFQMIFLFILISVPALVLSMFASGANMKGAKNIIANAKKNTMQMMVTQYDITSEAVEKNIQNILFGNKLYPALQFTPDNTRYQQSFIWLRDELRDTLGYFPQISGIYAYIPNTGDLFILKNDESFDYNRQLDFQKTLSNDNDFLNTAIFTSHEKKYIIKSLTNAYLEIGYLISSDFLEKQLYGSLSDQENARFIVGDDFIEIMSGEDAISPSNSKYYEIYDFSFNHMNIQMQLWMPSVNLDNKISASDRMIWYFSFALVILLPLYLLILRKIFLVPMNKLSTAMKEIMSGHSTYRIEQYSKSKEFLAIEQAFNQTLDYNDKLKIEAYEYKLQKEEQQLINLKLQINPHLLLNSLNTIYSLSENNKNIEIKEFSMNLAKYFRYSLRDSEEYVTIQSEIDFIKSYNKIQKIRYPDAFYIMFDIEEELMEERIPPLVIQNFVENSTKYALIPGQEIEIIVIVKKRDHYLDLSICDNGKGMDTKLLEKLKKGEVIYDSRGKHIGIWNCIRRLHSFFGVDCEVKITSKVGEGTQVWLHIPCTNQEMTIITPGGTNESTDC